MGRKRWTKRIIDETSILLPIVLTVSIIIFIVLSGDTLGFSNDLANDLVTVAPGVFIFIIGAFVLWTQKTGIFALPGFGAVGVGLAMLASYMNDAGFLINLLMGDELTLEMIQLFLIVFCLLLGAVVAATSRR